MRVLLAMSLFILIGCAGNKPVAEKSVDSENTKCEVLMSLPEEGKEILPSPSDTLFNADIQKKCPCNETINCNDVDYCYSFLCPDGRIIPWVR